jgi:predicted ribosome-associated RNA-binding protein Tma20
VTDDAASSPNRLFVVALGLGAVVAVGASLVGESAMSAVSLGLFVAVLAVVGGLARTAR